MQVLVICLHEKARIQMTDGVYPRLASLVRGSRGLCGSEGHWWIPVVEPVQTEPVPEARKRQYSAEYYKPKIAAHPSRPPREPYKLSSK